MDEGHLVMSGKERLRKSVFERVASGMWNLGEAADQLGLSYRQCKRSYARYRVEGDRGLVHRSRGRPSTRGRPVPWREAVLGLCRTELQGLGPTLAAEKLGDLGYRLDPETLRRWLIADGQWQRRRKRRPHRMWRERKARFGEMLQLDGSHHAWFGPEQPRACLMSLVDDATGACLTRMDEEETTEAAMRLLWKWINAYGVPSSLYLDRKSLYVAQRPPTLEEQLADETPLTAFGLACKKLGIALIAAHSPQAKGRVERKHGVYQDRFVHELRLQGITTIAGANALIDGGFDQALNDKFAQPPRHSDDAHRRLPAKLDLRDVFCTEVPRTVKNDWTIQHERQRFQILKLNDPLPRPGDQIIVRTWLEGRISLWFRERPLTFDLVPIADRQIGHQASNKTPQAPKGKAQSKSKPAPNHPWRRSLLHSR